MPVHEEKVLARAVAVLVPAPRITLAITRPGLPAQTTQGVLLVLAQLVPFVPRRVPQLVEQTMLRGGQPGQQLRFQRGTLARLGEGTLQGQELVVLHGQCQRAVQARNAPVESRRPGVAEPAPDLVEHDMAFIAGLGRKQAPAQGTRLVRQQVAYHAVAWLLPPTQALGGIQIAAQGAPVGCHIQEQLQFTCGQAIQPRILALQGPAPNAAQGIAQLLQAGIGQLDDGLARGFREFLGGTLALHIQRPQRTGHHHTRQCHTGDETASGNRHCIPVHSLRPWSTARPRLERCTAGEI